MANKLSKSRQLISRWAGHWKWQERLRAWTENLQAVEQQAIEKKARASAEEWARREQEFRERRWKSHIALMDKSDAMLKFPIARTVSADGQTIIEPGEWNFGHAARLAEVADKLGAEATGQASTTVAVTGKDGAPILPTAIGTITVYLPKKDDPPDDGD